jgi:hypothetical protein
MTLQLTDDRRCGVGRELEPAVGVEAVDGLEQAHRRHLDEVVEGFAPVHEPAGEVLGEPEVRPHELVPQLGVPRAAELCEGPAQLLAVGGVERHDQVVACRLSRRNVGPSGPSALTSCSSTTALRI